MSYMSIAITNNELTPIELPQLLGGLSIAASATKTIVLDVHKVVKNRTNVNDRNDLAEALLLLSNKHDVSIVLGTSSLSNSVPDIQAQIEAIALRSEIKGALRSGSVTLTAAASVPVVLNPPMPSNSYGVQLTAAFDPANDEPPFVTSKTAAGFTVTFATAQTGSVFWLAILD